MQSNSICHVLLGNILKLFPRQSHCSQSAQIPYDRNNAVFRVSRLVETRSEKKLSKTDNTTIFSHLFQNFGRKYGKFGHILVKNEILIFWKKPRKLLSWRISLFFKISVSFIARNSKNRVISIVLNSFNTVRNSKAGLYSWPHTLFLLKQGHFSISRFFYWKSRFFKIFVRVIQ